MITLKEYLFLLPFLCCICGYCIAYKLFNASTIYAPHLIGKSVHEALMIATHNNLNLRLIDQKEEIDIPEGIIINQTPTSQHTLKPNQIIFIVTSKKPPLKCAPVCTGKTVDAVVIACKEENIALRIYYVPHPYPQGICFAQSPQTNECMEKNRLTVYISSGNNKPIVWPNFIGKTENEVTIFLHDHQMKPYIIYDETHIVVDEPIVVDQRPTPGTLITLDDQKSIAIHLKVHYNA